MIDAIMSGIGCMALGVGTIWVVATLVEGEAEHWRRRRSRKQKTTRRKPGRIPAA